MSDKITVTVEKDGRIIVFEGSGTLTLIERVGGWVDTRPTSLSREVRGVEIEWDGDYTIREADRQPDTLGDLEAAWEAAEVTNECNAGDVLIVRDADGAFHVYTAVVDGSLKRARILSRAPRPQMPEWQALADVIREHTYEPDPKWLAQALYERGVRVTGGDEK